MNSPSQAHHERAMAKIMGDSDLRVMIFAIAFDDLKVGTSDFKFNAEAYALLALQSVGKRLIEDMRKTSPELTFKAECEYRQMIEQTQEYYNQHNKQEAE